MCEAQDREMETENNSVVFRLGCGGIMNIKKIITITLDERDISHLFQFIIYDSDQDKYIKYNATGAIFIDLIQDNLKQEE